MSALQHQASERPVDPAAEHADDRTWFLLESKWEDDVWVLAPANALEERHPVRLRWDFELQDGQRFTDERYAVLRETSRQLIALIRAHSMFTGLPLRPSTVAQYFFTLRCLLQWMDGEGFSRFAQLDPPALLQFQQWLRTRPWPVTLHRARREPCCATCTCLRTFIALAANSTTACPSTPSLDKISAGPPAITRGCDTPGPTRRTPSR